MENNIDGNIENAIAIVGMAGRFPEAKTLYEFWNNLYNGVESVKIFKRDDLLKMGIDEHLLDNPKFFAADAVLSDIDKFDASFFDYSAREAEITDPQHRLFLETAWEVLERAGYTSQKYDGRVSVFAGANLSSYMIRNLNTNPGLVDQLGSFKIMLSNGQDFLATKVSYKMDLKGPSVNVNTLCSSSMVALHYACKSLLDYDSDLALAGAVSIQISRNETFFYQEGGIGSSDGHVRAFDKDANGTVSGSGLGIVALKRLEDAIADGDHIEAVIRGTGINNDGAIKNSYTAPSVDGQAECIAEALAVAGINPETISYIDAHGTGTNLGDPIEIAALTKVYNSYTNRKQFCAIGSVKTNIGHLVHAGGIASLVKTVLSMQKKVIPATLNFEEPNPKIDFSNTPFYINSKRAEWKSGEAPRRAAVSSFGIGGTNTHVILEEAPKEKPSKPSKRKYKIITLSAKTASALKNMTENLKEFVITHPETSLDDMAFTLAVGRKDLSHKRVMTVKNRDELLESLSEESKTAITSFKKESDVKAVLKFEERLENFSGLSTIYETETAFKTAFDECAEIVLSFGGSDLRKTVFKNEIANDSDAIFKTFAVEYAFAKTLLSFKINFEAAVGSGVGNLVAKVITQNLSLKEALNSAFKKDFQTNRAEQQFSNDTVIFSFDYLKSEENSNVIFLNSKDGFSSLTFSQAVGAFWAKGGKLDWNCYYSDENRRRIVLPTYPFERQSYWIKPGNRAASKTESVENKLLKRERPSLETPYVEPKTKVEKTISKICEDILGYEKIGVNDDFFELGGHSLLAVALIAKLRKEFSRDITLEELFDNTTVAKIAPFFEEDSDDFDEGTL